MKPEVFPGAQALARTDFQQGDGAQENTPTPSISQRVKALMDLPRPSVIPSNPLHHQIASQFPEGTRLRVKEGNGKDEEVIDIAVGEHESDGRGNLFFHIVRRNEAGQETPTRVSAEEINGYRIERMTRPRT